MKKAAFYLEQLVGQEKEIDALYDEIERRKEQLRLNAIDSLLELRGDERHWLASQIYWLHVDYIPSSAVKSIYAQKGNQVPREIRALGVELPCRDCGNQTEYHFKSRSEHTRIMAELNRHMRGKGVGYSVLCSECAAIDKKRKEHRRNELMAYHQELKETREQLKTMPYAEYLKTEHWQKTRKTALQRAGFRCQTCNTQGILHVHHRTYANRGNENQGDLIVLCKDCHKVFHQNRELDKS